MTTFHEQHALLIDKTSFQEKLSQFHSTLDLKTVLCVPALCVDDMNHNRLDLDITTLRKWSIIMIPNVLLAYEASDMNAYMQAMSIPNDPIRILEEPTSEKTRTCALQRMGFAALSSEPFLYWMYKTK